MIKNVGLHYACRSGLYGYMLLNCFDYSSDIPQIFTQSYICVFFWSQYYEQVSCNLKCKINKIQFNSIQSAASTK